MGVAQQQGELIGRLDEQAALGRWLGEASAGTPRIVMLTGEPGMGKTLLLRSLVERAQALGVMSAWGSAVEGVEVPFLAAGPLLAGIPGGGEALDGGSQAPGSWGAAQSQNLVRAIDVVRQAAEDAPLLLVLDDVQWLDEATATFLQHLAIVAGTSTVPIHLLLAVAVREGDGSEPGLRTARRLARESITRHVRVGPLDEVETRELWHRLGGRYPTKQELGALIDRTGGCPLLIRARLVAPQISGNAQGFVGDDVLGGRLTSLPRKTRRAVEVLAVLGDRTPTSALSALLGPDHPDLLETAFDAELIVEDNDRISFDHSLYRHAVLQSLGEDRTASIAADLATVVSTEPLRSLLAPAVVAVHLRGAGEGVPLEVVASIRWDAGSEAYAAGAWGQASEHFEAALRAAEAADLEWPDRVDRWYQAGEAAFRDHDIRCAELLRTAIDIADPEADLDDIVLATVLETRALLTLGTAPDTLRVEAEVVHLAERDDPQLDRWRATLYGIAAECRDAALDVEAARRFSSLARQASGASDDPLSLWAVEISEGLQRLSALSMDDASECFARAIDVSGSAQSEWHEASSRHRADLVDLMRGHVSDVAGSSAVGMEVARNCHHWAECSFGGAIRTMVHALRGDTQVEIEAESAAAMYRRTSYMFSPSILFPALAYSRATRGDIEGAGEALKALEEIGQRAGPHWRSLDAFRELLTGVHPGRASRSPGLRPGPQDISRLAGLAVAAESAMAIAADSGDIGALDSFVAAVDEVLSAGVLLAPGWPHFFPRIRAELAFARGDEDLQSRLDWASEVAVREHLLFEIVMLELLRSRAASDRSEAAEFASSALRRADHSGHLSGVAVAQRRLVQLGAPHHEPLARVVLNTDIVSSTEMTRILGDEAWLEVLDEHDELIRSTIRRNGGVIFKHTGDGMFAWFVTADDGVQATETILGEFMSRQLHHGTIAVQLRVGISQGSPLSRADGDLFGLTVIEAARLCSAARPGTGLAAANVAESASRPLVACGSLDLKGFDAAVETYEVTPVA